MVQDRMFSDIGFRPNYYDAIYYDMHDVSMTFINDEQTTIF